MALADLFDPRGPVGTLLGDAAIFLIVGGLSMLALVILLVLLRSALPFRRRPTDDGRTPRRLRPTRELGSVQPGRAPHPGRLDPDAVDEGRKAARRARAKRLDEALAEVHESGWGEPRVLRVREGLTLFRVYGCRDCGGAAGGRPAEGAAGCGFLAGYFAATLERLNEARARVVETACRRTGHGACEFEVRT